MRCVVCDTIRPNGSLQDCGKGFKEYVCSVCQSSIDDALSDFIEDDLEEAFGDDLEQSELLEDLDMERIEGEVEEAGRHGSSDSSDEGRP